MKRLTVLLLSVLLGSLLPACRGGTAIRYSVTGTAAQVNVRYVNENGSASAETIVTLPFEIEIRAASPVNFQVYAANISGQGEIRCEVFADGQSLGSASGTTFAGCEGTYERRGDSTSIHFKGYDDVFPEGVASPEIQPAVTEPVVPAHPEQIDLDGAIIMALGTSESGAALYLFDTSSGTIVQWTEPLGFIGCADWSPVESRLAFNSGVAGDVHTYVAALAENQQPRITDLTKAPGGDGCPDWSPDGEFIALDARVPVGHNILYMNTEATILRGALTRGDSSINTHPDWSPDGTMVVYRSLRDFTISGIQVAFLDGTDPVTLIESESESYAGPVWSPDGKRVAFVLDVKGPEASVYVMDANGENVEPVTTQAFNHIDSVAWSPDGTRLLFNAMEQEVGFRGIYIINVDGTGLTYLTGLPDVNLSELRFVPDGYITELPSQMISLQP